MQKQKCGEEREPTVNESSEAAQQPQPRAVLGFDVPNLLLKLFITQLGKCVSLVVGLRETIAPLGRLLFEADVVNGDFRQYDLRFGSAHDRRRPIST